MGTKHKKKQNNLNIISNSFAVVFYISPLFSIFITFPLRNDFNKSVPLSAKSTRADTVLTAPYNLLSIFFISLTSNNFSSLIIESADSCCCWFSSGMKTDLSICLFELVSNGVKAHFLKAFIRVFLASLK